MPTHADVHPMRPPPRERLRFARVRYIEPTLLDFGSDFAAFNASEAMQDELFGPILPMFHFTTLDQARLSVGS